MVSESLDGLTGNLSLLTDHDHVELETTLQELVLNLLGDGVETDIRRRTNFLDFCGHFDGIRDGWTTVNTTVATTRRVMSSNARFFAEKVVLAKLG